MATKLNIPAPDFATNFTTASNFEPGYLDFSAGLVDTQFRIEEDTKDYATAVEQSSLLIGLDVQRLIAVDVAGIQIQVAKDKALYKSVLADSVKTVKIQEARLEGGFGIDAALVKSVIDLESLNRTSGLQEESTTMLSGAEAASVITLSQEEERSAAYVLGKERVFRMGLADTDYVATTALADTRGASILSKGLLEKQSVVAESHITDAGLSTAYTLEATGYSATASIETAYIRSSGIAEVGHIRDISGVRVESIKWVDGVETGHILQDASTKVRQLVAETNAQMSATTALSNLEVNHINTAGALDVSLIKLTAASEDEAYLAGARADISIDIAKHVAEADGIKAIAAASLELITIKAQADADTKIAVAKIQGQVDIDKTKASNKSEHDITVEKGKHMKNISDLRVESTKAIANIRASQTSDLSGVVVKQLDDDANQAAAFTAATSLLDIQKFASITAAEGEASISKTGSVIAHTAAMAGLNAAYLQAQSGAQIKSAAAVTKQATDLMGKRLVEEQSYITASNAAAAMDITELGSRTLEYIATETEISNKEIRGKADIQYSAAVIKADTDYGYNTETSATLLSIQETMTTWEEAAHRQAALWDSQWQQEIGQLSRYSVAHHNYWPETTEFSGDAPTTTIGSISFDVPSEPGLPAPVSN